VGRIFYKQASKIIQIIKIYFRSIQTLRKAKKKKKSTSVSGGEVSGPLTGDLMDSASDSFGGVVVGDGDGDGAECRFT
jgi:hypothetical protein